MAHANITALARLLVVSLICSSLFVGCDSHTVDRESLQEWADGARQGARAQQAAGAPADEQEHSWTSALELYEMVLERAPNSREALRGAAECYRQLGQTWEASTMLSQLIRLDPQHDDVADLYSERAEVLYEYGWIDDTIRDLTKALHHRPGNVDLLSQRAEYALLNRDIPLALHDVEESMQGDLTERQWITKAKVLTYLRLFPLAEQACQEALNLAPNSFEALRQQALSKFAQQDYAAATPLLESLNERDEAAEMPVWQALVDCHIANEDHLAAANVIEQQIQRAPEALYLYYELADHYLTANQPQRAADTLLNALVSPQLQSSYMPQLRYRVAQFYKDRGDWSEAAIQYQAALDLEDTPYIGDRYELVAALNKCGKHARALALCDRFMELAHESGWEPAFKLQKAVALAGQKQFQDALALIETLPQGYIPLQDDAFQARADLYLAAGQIEPAIAELQLIRSGHRHNPWASDQLITALEHAAQPQAALGERWLQFRQLDNQNCIIADELPTAPRPWRLRSLGPEPILHYTSAR